jgi:hypothetical protein
MGGRDAGWGIEMDEREKSSFSVRPIAAASRPAEATTASQTAAGPWRHTCQGPARDLTGSGLVPHMLLP